MRNPFLVISVPSNFLKMVIWRWTKEPILVRNLFLVISAPSHFLEVIIWRYTYIFSRWWFEEALWSALIAILVLGLCGKFLSTCYTPNEGFWYVDSENIYFFDRNLPQQCEKANWNIFVKNQPKISQIFLCTERNSSVLKPEES